MKDFWTKDKGLEDKAIKIYTCLVSWLLIFVSYLLFPDSLFFALKILVLIKIVV